MSEKKSLVIPNDFPPVVSGIATYFYEIWRYFPTENHTILCPKDKGWKTLDNVIKLNVIRRRIPSGDSIIAKLLKGKLYAFWVLILHLKYRFDVIHCGQVLSSGFTGWLMKKLFRVPYIVYVYGSETFRFGRNPLLIRLIGIFLRNADRIVPNSRFTMDEFLALGIPEEKFRIVTPGVDTARFIPAKKDENLMKKYGLAEKNLILLTVARLDERKGHDMVIRALPALVKKFPQIVYLVVGKGREEARLKQIADENSVTDYVIFCGYVADADLPKFYQLCDIFILLNRQTSDDDRLRGDYEGFGIVFLEASSCGKSVVAGNYGGIADAVADG
ncbi:MAG: glycosyltransferase family 4 protein [Candidatus Marinimicrobia bacterium]|nr:glycosyltransferase family 4 protein [Candidatus Neomarinimicrobiota bacterium]